MPCNPLDYRNRLNVLAEQIVGQDLDLVLLFDRDNIQYFTGFQLNRVVSSILAVSPDGAPTYIVAQLDLARAKRDCWIECVIPFVEDTSNYLSALGPLFKDSLKRVGVETDALTTHQAEHLRQLGGSGLEFVDVRKITTKQRLVKSEEEIACIRQAARIADRVTEQVLQEVKPGVTEAELVGKVEYLIRLETAEGASFEPFVMSGENAWLPQRVASDKPLKEGELVLLDLGAVYEGYCSDLTRTFSVGHVSDEQQRLFRVAWKAQQAAIDAVRPWIPAGEVDAVARRVIEQEGFGDYFPHLTGHGVGVSTHEPPILDRGVDMVLEPGMITTIEPGIYVPGVGAARVEDMVLVTESGCEVLTAAPRDLVGKA